MYRAIENDDDSGHRHTVVPPNPLNVLFTTIGAIRWLTGDHCLEWSEMPF